MNKGKLSLVKSVWNTKNHYYARQSVKKRSETVSQLAASIFCPGPSYYYVLDFSSREFNFVSTGIQQVLGVKAQEFSIKDFFERLHPDDLEHLLNCEKIIIDFLFESIPIHKITSYKFSYCFRMRHADGKYRHILHQAMAITQDEDGKMSQVLDIDTDIGYFAPHYTSRLSIIGLHGEPSYMGVNTVNGVQAKIEQESSPFTLRETELIRLLSQGFSTKEIADMLFLSRDTVRKHRENILRKSGCKNTIAVIAMCIRNGYV